jgi:preprotein translocase SecE subunit
MGIITYFKDTAGEMKHINWPTFKQALVFTVLIILISLFVAALLGFFDWSFTSLIERFI